jgi:hypothetical protein
MTMQTVELTGSPASEDETVRGWRFEQLRAAGYPQSAARALADRRDIDLHVALGLLARGCDPETALRILL